MYNNSTAVYRPDIQGVVQQAQGADKYFIAQKVLPVLNVLKPTGQYPVIKIAGGGLLNRDVSKRNATGTYNEIERAHTWDNFKLEDRGLKVRIDDDKAAQMKSFFDLEVTETKLLVRNLNIDLEIEAAATLYDTGVFPVTEPKAAGNYYTETLIAGCDFPYDMENALNDVILRGTDVNTIVMSNVLWQYIRRTKKLQDYLFGSEPTKKKLIRAADVAEAFSETIGRSLQVIIASAGYNTANRAKATAALTPIWPATHIWLGDVKGGEFSEGGVGRTLSWTDAVPSGLFQTETWRDEERRGDMVRTRSYCDHKVIDETAGQLIATHYSAS